MNSGSDRHAIQRAGRPVFTLVQLVSFAATKYSLRLRNSSISFIRKTCCFLFLAAMMVGNAFAFLGIGEETKSWKEDVPLVSGTVLSVKRETVYGSDQWGRKGRGSLQKQSITFSYGGTKIEWTGNDIRPIWYSPVILEIVDGEPVIVVPVHGWGACFKFGFPLEGLIAYKLIKGRWQRIDLQGLPDNLVVNLLQNSRYDRVSISVSEKNDYERKGHPPRIGNTLAELVQYLPETEQSCARMRPPPNPELERATQRIADAERTAPTVEAKVLHVQTDPEEITATGYRELKGEWTGAGWLAATCKGIVAKLERIDTWSGDQHQARAQRSGYQLILARNSSVKPRVQIRADARTSLHSVVCTDTAIHAVRTAGKTSLLVHRFRHDGGLIDAFRISIADPATIISGPAWGSLWTVVVNPDGYLDLSMADYSYKQLAQYGGTLVKKVTYRMQPPPIPQ